MLTYRIAKPKVPRKFSGKPPAIKSFNEKDKELILKANLDKNFFEIGDRVKFKKPRRNPPHGVVVGIQTNVEEITWVSGGSSPMNIVVEIERTNQEGLTWTERVKTNVKKLIYVGRTQ